MRIGIKIPHQGTTWTAVRDAWRVADQLDVFDSAWTYDHLAAIGHVDGGLGIVPGKPMLEGWTLLAALAAETTRLRVGNLVTCAPLRHPAVLAKMVTTVAEISDGRLELGLGAGWMEAEAEMFGIELGSPRDRLDRFEEALAVITGLVSGATVDLDGRFYRLRGAQVAPALATTPPRIWIGGNGEQRTLRLVARYADAWNYTALRPGGGLDAFRAKRQVLAGRCVEVGRDPRDVMVSTQLSLGDGPGACAEDVARWRDAGADYVIVMVPEGSGAALVEELAGALEPLRGDEVGGQ